MSADSISSRRHAIVRELRDVRDSSAGDFAFLEGPRLIQEALHSKLPLELLVWSTAVSMDSLLDDARAVAKRAFSMTESVFRAVSDVESPQGILALVRRPVWEWKDLLSHVPEPLLVLDGIQDPGNLATIVRTAEAAGAAGLITTPGTARLFSPKALRGAMGASLRVPCLEQRPIPETAAALKKNSYSLLAASMKLIGKPSVIYTSVDWKKPIALLLGREGSGFSPEWNGLIDAPVHIPMKSSVESLNVAAAAAVLLYEFVRQNA